MDKKAVSGISNPGQHHYILAMKLENFTQGQWAQHSFLVPAFFSATHDFNLKP